MVAPAQTLVVFGKDVTALLGVVAAVIVSAMILLVAKVGLAHAALLVISQ